MHRALAQFQDVSVTQQLLDLDTREGWVGVLLAIDEPLAHHFDKACEVRRRIDAESREMARVECAQHFEDDTA